MWDKLPGHVTGGHGQRPEARAKHQVWVTPSFTRTRACDVSQRVCPRPVNSADSPRHLGRMVPPDYPGPLLSASLYENEPNSTFLARFTVLFENKNGLSGKALYRL